MLVWPVSESLRKPPLFSQLSIFTADYLCHTAQLHTPTIINSWQYYKCLIWENSVLQKIFTTGISCAILHPPSHGFVRLTGRRVGDTAFYSCSNGYTLVGKSRRECKPTGTWSGESPWCTRRGENTWVQSFCWLYNYNINGYTLSR